VAKPTISVREAAQRLGVSGHWVRQHIKRGELTAIKVGNGRTAPWMLYEEDLADIEAPIPTRIGPSHGHATKERRTPTYQSWRAMRERCRNPGNGSYHCYGARGITVCGRWQGAYGFDNFLADMGERPEGLTLDRIDNDGNYEPTNCRWATRSEQRRNQRGAGARQTANVA
jgi:excisionase family DNA binding protein